MDAYKRQVAASEVRQALALMCEEPGRDKAAAYDVAVEADQSVMWTTKVLDALEVLGEVDLAGKHRGKKLYRPTR